MSFSVTTYNIKFSSFIFEDEIARVSEELDSDILCLQEFPMRKLAAWKDVLAAEGFRDLLVQQTCETLLGTRQANIIFSKFPLEDKHSLDLTFRKRETRKAQYCLVDIGDEQVFLLHTHLGLGRKERLWQMRQIASVLERHHESEKMVLTGDFNDWNNAGERELGPHFVEAHSSLHGVRAKSFPARLPLFRLDRVYCRNLTPVFCEVLNGPWIRKKSDHLPIKTVFDF